MNTPPVGRVSATMRYVATIALVLVASAASVRPARAQGRLVDEGTLVISREGAPAGRETFRIVRVPSGTGELYRATAQIAVGERRMTPTLVADSTGAPVSYDLQVRNGPAATDQLRGRTRPGRFSAILQTPRGESAREYALPAHTVVLDDGVFHQYFFLGLTNGTGTVSVLSPLASTQWAARLERTGTEQVEIGGRTAPATHYRLVAAGQPAREFWLDSAGRLLRVSIPDRGISVQRDELPR